jgi:hypothetical protein
MFGVSGEITLRSRKVDAQAVAETTRVNQKRLHYTKGCIDDFVNSKIDKWSTGCLFLGHSPE